jgi:DHA3 family macrolide efflux protein-like MFS transporter
MWNSNFKKYFSGQIISVLGLALFNTSLPFLILYLDGDAKDISGVQSMFIIPQLCILLFGGILVDRLPKKPIIITLDILRGIALSIIVVLIVSGNILLWHVYILTLLLGMFSTIYRPALKAFLPSIIHKDYLIKANSYRSMIREISEMFGPVVAAFLVSVIGIFMTFGITAVSFILAAVVYMFIIVERKPIVEERKTVIHDFKEGFNILIRHQWLGLSILIGSIVNIGIASFDVIILPVYANTHFDGIESYGIFLSSMAIGAFLGAIVSSRQSKVKNKMSRYYFYMLILGIFILLLPILNHLYFSLLLMISIGFSITSFIILWESTIQEAIEEKYLGRVTSLQMFGGLLFLPVGYYFFGWIADNINIESSLLISAIIIIISSLLGIILQRKYNIRI